MIYVLLVAVAALILGPVFWMRPTPREKRLARMRMKARGLNLQLEPVSLATDKVYAALALRNPHWPRNGWMRYRMYPAHGVAGPAQQAAWRQRRDKSGEVVWDEDPVAVVAPAAVQVILTQWYDAKDERFLALEMGERSVAIIWNEEGDEPEVEQVAAWLKSVLAAV